MRLIVWQHKVWSWALRRTGTQTSWLLGSIEDRPIIIALCCQQPLKLQRNKSTEPRWLASTQRHMMSPCRASERGWVFPTAQTPTISRGSEKPGLPRETAFVSLECSSPKQLQDTPQTAQNTVSMNLSTWRGNTRLEQVKESDFFQTSPSNHSLGDLQLSRQVKAIFGRKVKRLLDV